MGAANVREYLDRGLENQEFLASFPNTTVTYLPQTRSDHHPICVRDREDLNQLRLEKPFRMLDAWFTHPGFEKLVKESWCTSKPSTHYPNGRVKWWFHLESRIGKSV